MRRAVFFGYPHPGGTHTVYRALRTGLAAHGWEVRWLGLAGIDPSPNAWHRTIGPRDDGELIERAGTPRAMAQAHLEALRRVGAELVFVNVLADALQMRLAAYLPPDIRRIQVVHSITPGTYEAARAVRPHVHATVGVSERIRADLVAYHGFAPERTFAVANTLPEDPGPVVHRARRAGPLRIVSLGRIEDASKGVFWFPTILGALPPDSYHLTIGGDGYDWPELERRLKAARIPHTYLGRVSAGDVPKLLREQDVLLFPSRYEGFGLTLIEAMAQGCVPVAASIRGVTDTIVEDGRTGLLFPVGECDAAGRLLGEVAADRDRLRSLAEAGMLAVRERFVPGSLGAGYARVIESCEGADAQSWPISEFRLPQTSPLATLRNLVPNRVKSFLRGWLLRG